MKMESEPSIRKVYEDCEGRSLNVCLVNKGNVLGREVQGYLYLDDIEETREDYSCTLKMWEEIWRDRVPRCNPEKMKIG